MNNKFKKFLPLLIIIFIICFCSFIYLNKDLIFKDDEIKENIDIEDKDEPTLEIEDQENLEKPEEDVVTDTEEEVLEENNTTTDKKEDEGNKVESNSKPNNSNNTKPNSSTNNSNNTKPNKPNSSTNNNNSDSTNNNNNNDNNDNGDNIENDVNKEPVEEDIPSVTPTPIPTPTQEELNDIYRNNIQSTYGIKIAYGEEMGNYLVGSRLPEKMTDPNDINEYLGRIDKELKKYPVGFFKEIRDYGMSVTFYLIKDIPNSDISGITNSQFYSNIVISVKEGLLFEKTLNHEIMHYIDAYLNSKLYPNTVETEWYTLNPDGFVYGVFDASYDYFPTQNNNAYFFSSYSQTNYKEDRATLFEDIMTRSYTRPCYSSGYPLYNKLKLLAEQIDAGFNTVNSDTVEYWEKYL